MTKKTKKFEKRKENSERRQKYIKVNIATDTYITKVM
jgi:hypothetical protein